MIFYLERSLSYDHKALALIVRPEGCDVIQTYQEDAYNYQDLNDDFFRDLEGRDYMKSYW